MKIQINSQDIDYLFEQEDSLEDIVEFMMDWSVKRRLVLYSCCADEVEFSPEDVPYISLENIKILNFNIKSQVDIMMSSFEEAGNYCNNLIKLLGETSEDKNPSDSMFVDIKNGLEWIAELLHSAAGILSLDLDKPLYKTFSLSDFILKIENYVNKYSSLDEITQINEINKINKIEALKEAVEIAYEAKEFIASFLISSEMNNLVTKSIDSPDVLLSKLLEIQDAFPDELDNIEQIAILLQSGKDAEAIEKLNRFIEFVYFFIRVCAQFLPVFDIPLKEIVKDGISIEEKNAGLQEKLSELVSIMENNDMIGLADILEYEIKPDIEDIQSYIDILISKVDTTQ
jgi:hypothetical protein